MAVKKEGRKLPTIIKERRGTLRKDRVNQHEPTFDNAESIPLSPDTIKTNEGRELWNRSVRQLHSVGLLFPSCYEMLEKYCQAYESMNDALAHIAQHGKIIENHLGNFYKNPAATIYNESFTQFFALGRELGFTPVSKSKLVTDAGSQIPGKNNAKKKTSFRS